MIVYTCIVIIMTLLGSIASLYLKKASGAHGILSLLKNINLYIGAILYFISAIINIIILRKLDYSVVLPLTSLTYIWTMLLSSSILKERITRRKIVGVFLILIGAIGVAI